ncbi:MAG TPA: response regulator transcription factor [Candidatus Acidoferrales bacterium]|nr:response regulator transcription factor [Candidatus Acidoferrales bacterium]
MSARELTVSSKDQTSLSLLLIDDDAELGNMMKEFFTLVGYRLDCAYSGREGLDRALKGTYDLIILDVMLPMISGFTVLQQLRRRKTVPVIMLTARIQHRDRIIGLNAGADDYLPKPFDPDELLARIRAVLRRSGRLHQEADFIKKFADVQVDRQTREVWSGGRIVDLTALEFDILNLLISAEGRVVSREEISASLLDRDASPYDRAIDVHISHLRRKLETGGELIHTVRGVGYVFAAKGLKE